MWNKINVCQTNQFTIFFAKKSLKDLLLSVDGWMLSLQSVTTCICTGLVYNVKAVQTQNGAFIFFHVPSLYNKGIPIYRQWNKTKSQHVSVHTADRGHEH